MQQEWGRKWPIGWALERPKCENNDREEVDVMGPQNMFGRWVCWIAHGWPLRTSGDRAEAGGSGGAWGGRGEEEWHASGARRVARRVGHAGIHFQNKPQRSPGISMLAVPNEMVLACGCNEPAHHEGMEVFQGTG